MQCADAASTRVRTQSVQSQGRNPSHVASYGNNRLFLYAIYTGKAERQCGNAIKNPQVRRMSLVRVNALTEILLRILLEMRDRREQAQTEEVGSNVGINKDREQILIRGADRMLDRRMEQQNDTAGRNRARQGGISARARRLSPHMIHSLALRDIGRSIIIFQSSDLNGYDSSPDTRSDRLVSIVYSEYPDYPDVNLICHTCHTVTPGKLMEMSPSVEHWAVALPGWSTGPETTPRRGGHLRQEEAGLGGTRG
ncbi:hypothetical protein RRG08_014245 [Elysia crispata]|uniref:Uncharacterized protein n=1 Tax=Elysia crispata TaxID=231223 RepID=A0AAE0XEC9_9GAST|nr:hypothetical protein RRG08_014245 [Elysia crispata]